MTSVTSTIPATATTSRSPYQTRSHTRPPLFWYGSDPITGAHFPTATPPSCNGCGGTGHVNPMVIAIPVGLLVLISLYALFDVCRRIARSEVHNNREMVVMAHDGVENRRGVWEDGPPPPYEPRKVDKANHDQSTGSSEPGVRMEETTTLPPAYLGPPR